MPAASPGRSGRDQLFLPLSLHPPPLPRRQPSPADCNNSESFCRAAPAPQSDWPDSEPGGGGRGKLHTRATRRQQQQPGGRPERDSLTLPALLLGLGTRRGRRRGSDCPVGGGVGWGERENRVQVLPRRCGAPRLQFSPPGRGSCNFRRARFGLTAKVTSWRDCRELPLARRKCNAGRARLIIGIIISLSPYSVCEDRREGALQQEKSELLAEAGEAFGG